MLGIEDEVVRLNTAACQALKEAYIVVDRCHRWQFWEPDEKTVRWQVCMLAMGVARQIGLDPEAVADTAIRILRDFSEGPPSRATLASVVQLFEKAGEGGGDG